MNKRFKKMIRMREKGKTFTEIAEFFGMSRQRAHQIIMNYQTSNLKVKQVTLFRDGFKCQWGVHCKDVKKLVVHHIDINSKNNNIDNLITLCTDCHCKFHALERLETCWKKLLIKNKSVKHFSFNDFSTW